MRRGIIASAGAVALAVALGSVSAVSAVSAAQSAKSAKVSGPEKIFVTPNDTTTAQHPGKIVLTGTVADYGTVVATNAKGKPTAKGEYRQLEMKKGTMLVDIAEFNKAITKAFSHATFDKTTCSISVAVSGTITIVSGTKTYAGASGTIRMNGQLAEITARTKSGACTTKTTTEPLVTYFEITGSGTVTVP